jgi:hypothetical protein
MSDTEAKPWAVERKREPRLLRATVKEYAELEVDERGTLNGLADLLAREYKKTVKAFQEDRRRLPDDDPYKLRLTDDRIHEYAAGLTVDAEGLDRIRNKQPRELTYNDLQTVVERDPEEALRMWGGMLDASHEYIASGAYAADFIGSHDGLWGRAHFHMIRHAFFEDWQPRGGIESAMIEMMAQSFVLWNRWLNAATNIELNGFDTRREDERLKYAPRPSDAEALNQALAMADRFNRMFMRTLRQMRDLRRYSAPVVINNPQQVNVAAEGGQQVNVQKSAKKSRQNRAAKNLSQG